MSNNPHNLKVGQELWLAFHDGRFGNNHAVIVVSVGRKWAAISRTTGGGFPIGRISLDDLRLDSGSYTSRATAWLSKREYDDSVALRSAWSAFRSAVNIHHKTPESATIEAITDAAKRLGLKVPE